MKNDWIDKTLSGIPLLIGTVVRIDPVKLPATVNGCYQPRVSSGVCPPCGNVYPTVAATPAYTLDACAYLVNIDLPEQVDINSITGLPWVPTDADVCEIIPFVCYTNTLIEAIDTNFGIQVDCTLKRDGNVIGIGETEETEDGYAKLVALGADGCVVRVAPLVVLASMSDASSSQDDISANVPLVIDYDVIENDPEGTVVTGPGWIFTAPRTGLYRLTASIRFSNTTWGHHAGSDYAAISLYTRKNSDAAQSLATQYVSGFDDTEPVQQAPEVHGTRIFSLTAGDTLQILAEHTDDHLGAVHGMVSSNSRVSIEKIA